MTDWTKGEPRLRLEWVKTGRKHYFVNWLHVGLSPSSLTSALMGGLRGWP